MHLSRLLAAGSSAALALTAFSPAVSHANPQVQVFDNTITVKEVEQAQKAWCNALIAISNSFYVEGEAAARSKAGTIIDVAYGYAIGPVAFKPTLATGQDTFRPTRAGALAYFVGPDTAFPSGKGFATYRRWKTCTVNDNVVQLFGKTANTMGFVTLTDDKGVTTTVENTWTFYKTEKGDIRIVLHHSSAPVDAR